MPKFLYDQSKNGHRDVPVLENSAVKSVLENSAVKSEKSFGTALCSEKSFGIGV